ncbi:MAG TPA: hypothetical protein VHD81_04435 [Mycobacteriales bacterium]|nr:hypothetical protein [Mycobacteriales bacterium]
MERSDVIRGLREYRAQLLADQRRIESELRKTENALAAFGQSEARGHVEPGPRTRRARAGNDDSAFARVRALGEKMPPGMAVDAREALDILVRDEGWRPEGLADPVNAVNSAMFRLAKMDEWVKVGRGRYMPRRSADEAAIAADVTVRQDSLRLSAVRDVFA